MRVLIACEFSGVVREAFRKRGHYAISCDLLPAEDGSASHITGDALEVIRSSWKTWDLMIAHPPCTHLAVSGARWFKEKKNEQRDALAFVVRLMESGIPRVCIENPISVISSKIRKPDQIVQPWMFGHPESKATCLWLKNLPKLRETRNVKAQMASLPLSQRTRVHFASPGPDRWKERSRTLEGIADAMAEQWGRLDASLDAARTHGGREGIGE
jgi:hypothetical protein